MTGLTDLPGKIREYGLLIRWFALEVDRVKRRIHDKRSLFEAFEESDVVEGRRPFGLDSLHLCRCIFKSNMDTGNKTNLLGKSSEAQYCVSKMNTVVNFLYDASHSKSIAVKCIFLNMD